MLACVAKTALEEGDMLESGGNLVQIASIMELGVQNATYLSMKQNLISLTFNSTWRNTNSYNIEAFLKRQVHELGPLVKPKGLLRGRATEQALQISKEVKCLERCILHILHYVSSI